MSAITATLVELIRPSFDRNLAFDMIAIIKQAVSQPRPLSKKERLYRDKMMEIIAASPYFDIDFYREKNPDVAGSLQPPVYHYLLYGGTEGRDPSPGFTARKYQLANPDIIVWKTNPLLHYELFGREEGRAIEPGERDFRHIAYVDVIDKCQLSCPNCIRGVQIMKNTGSTMPIETFRQVAARLKEQNYSTVGLYSWTEPFLLRTLDQYVKAVKDVGLVCDVSTNLSHPKSWQPSIIKALAAGVDLLIISISGFTQPVYEVYHRNGRIDWIKDNLIAIAEKLKTGEIKSEIRLRLLRWEHNKHEEVLCREFAESLGISFEAINGLGDPSTPFDMKHKQAIEGWVATTSEEEAREAYEKDRAEAKVCHLLTQTLAIDSAGDVFECCAYEYLPELNVGNYLSMTDDEILRKRFTHRVCTKCPATRRPMSPVEKRRVERALA